MKFGDLAIFAKVGWEILENRVKCPEIHENESHFAIHFRGATSPHDGPRGVAARRYRRADSAVHTRPAAAGVPCPMREATLVRASFSTDHDPTQLLIDLLRRRMISLCPQLDRGLHFMAWCVQSYPGQHTSTVYIWARATPGRHPSMTAWKRTFPGAQIELMHADQWVNTLTNRAQNRGLFCSPAKVKVSNAALGSIVGGIPVFDMEQHILDMSESPALESAPTEQLADGCVGTARRRAKRARARGVQARARSDGRH